MNLCNFIGIFTVVLSLINFGKGLQSLPEELNFLCQNFPDVLKEQCNEYHYNKFHNEKTFALSALKETKWLECKICKLVIEFVIKEIGSKRTEKAIRKALKIVCDKIHIKKAKCVQFVDKYTKEIVKYILANISVEDICKKLGVCKKITENLEISFPEEIKFLCKIFPDILKEKCDDYNHNEYQNVIKFTMNDELTISALKERNWLECKICKLVIEFLIKEIGSNRTEEAIRKALKILCDKIHFKKAKCIQFDDKYTEEIVKYILANIPVEEICKKLGVCKKMSENLEILRSFEE